MRYRSTQRVIRTRDSGPRMHEKNVLPAQHERWAAMYDSSAAQTLLVSYKETPYSRSKALPYRSSSDLSDPSTYCRFCLKNQSRPTGHVTGECLHVAQRLSSKLEVRREAIYSAYHSSQKMRYHPLRRTTPAGRLAIRLKLCVS